MVNRTPTRDRIKLLLREVGELDNAINSASKRTDLEPSELKTLQSLLKECKNKLLTESESLKPLARLEDMSIFKVKKRMNKKKTLNYWFAAWSINGKNRNIYIGSCICMDEEAALKKARTLKAKMLGLPQDLVQGIYDI
jgi:hypothetical protein